MKFCNLDARPAQHLTAALTGFGVKRGGDPVLDEEFWLDPGAPESLAPGECQDLLIQTRGFRTVDDGNYTGVLVVTSGGAGRVRRKVTVSKSEKLPAAAAIGVSDPVSFTAKAGPFSDASLDDDGMLPLKIEKSGQQELQLPEPDTLVGTVTKGTNVGSVFVDGGAERQKSKGLVFLPLRVEGIEHVGEYSGSVDLAPSGGEAQEVELNVSVTHRWGWAVLSILAGAALALLAQLLLRRWRVKRNLKARLTALTTSYSDAVDDFHRAYPSFEHIAGPTERFLNAYIADVLKAIEVDMESSWYFDSTSESFKNIVAAIERAERDAECLGSRTGLGKHLVDLDAALESVDGELSDFPLDHPPALVAAARAVFKGGPLKVGEATARAATADEYTALVAEFKVMAIQAWRLELWAIALEADADATPGRWRYADRESLIRAYAKVMEAKNELLDASDAAALKKLGAAHDLDAAYGVLAVLGGRYGVWVKPLRLEEVSPGIRDAAAQMHHFMALSQARTPLKFVGDLIQLAARSPVLVRSKGWIADVSIIGLSLVAGLLGALELEYFGKSWGSTVDYLTAIFVGAASQGLVTGLGDTVTKMTVGTRTARTASPATAAAATPSVAKIVPVPAADATPALPR